MKNVMILVIFLSIASCNKKKTTYFERIYLDNKSDFIYFSSLKNGIFKDNIGCHAYSIILTIRGAVWLNCNDYQIDSSEYYKDSFLIHDDVIRVKKFMETSNLYAINFVPDSVLFYFKEDKSRIIFNTKKSIPNDGRFKKIDSNFYVTERKR